jgi:hypothetical protein
MILFAFAFLLVIFIGITLVLLLLKLIFKKKIFGKIILGLWLFFISIPFLLIITSIFTTKKEIDKSDIYGSYVINRNKCAGKQADWQYNHYRFKITEDNKIFFYITEKENIIKTIEGTVTFSEGYASPEIKLDFEEPKFHVLQENPTLYREIWTFYYVFESSKFGNMFFTKGNWKSID